MNETRTITLHRGLLALGERIAAAVPHGAKLWEGGLGDVARAALKRSTIPEEVTADDLLDQIQHTPVRRRRKCRT